MSSFLTSAAKNFGFEQQTEHDERYLRAEEYLTSVGLPYCYRSAPQVYLRLAVFYINFGSLRGALMLLSWTVNETSTLTLPVSGK